MNARDQMERAYRRQVRDARMKVYRELRRAGEKKLAEAYYRENIRGMNWNE